MFELRHFCNFLFLMLDIDQIQECTPVSYPIDRLFLFTNILVVRTKRDFIPHIQLLHSCSSYNPIKCPLFFVDATKIVMLNSNILYINTVVRVCQNISVKCHYGDLLSMKIQIYIYTQQQVPRLVIISSCVQNRSLYSDFQI